MKQYLQHDEWQIIEEGFNPAFNKISESIFSLGNGRMGQRANFEEQYSGEKLQGNYVAGIYYPDKTRVGWWKNGYPEYFAKVLNAPNWIGIDVYFDGEPLDLAKGSIEAFRRVLCMKTGKLERDVTVKLSDGRRVDISSVRFCSMADDEVGAIRYRIKPLNFSGTLTITSYVDADVINQDANYGEKFWVEVETKTKRSQAYVTAETKKTKFQVCTGMRFSIFQNGSKVDFDSQRVHKEKYVGRTVDMKCEKGKDTVIYKYAGVVSSLNYAPEALLDKCQEAVKRAYEAGFDALLEQQAEAWAAKWAEADIRIEGDVSAQQAIRFNIFQLYQTYTGEDARLNIGPKGFTGEKYGGSTYWDTEAYCLPFYQATADPHVARNLLVYRHRQLGKAIENAEKLGFHGGAALYPMVTMNGEECHNEWEITFEEIHRNGAIAYAIFDYVRYTGDSEYLASAGAEVLLAIARFWAQRVHFSQPKQQYVIHGVTGPNEYENNVNNNWYTNYIAAWCLRYAAAVLEEVQTTAPEAYQQLTAKTAFQAQEELAAWNKIADQMYLPKDDSLGIFLQQESFLDKALMPVTDIPAAERPINQHWSWDRILRSCFIKQADVLQGLYFFEDRFSEEEIRRNFDFYEPMTVHESSLSPCVHAILAARLGQEEKAYEMYLRTARLDLDDYNNDTEDGCHITSMAGTWMSVVKGFGGLRVHNDVLYINPMIPKQWQSYQFKIRFRGSILLVKVNQQEVVITNLSDKTLRINLYQQEETLHGGGSLSAILA
jgi:maltose phosphorylase